MILKSLEVTQVRNLQSFKIDPHPVTNFVVGPNGSGKTSLLEAIHVLSSGRSFRTPIVKKLVSHGCSELVVFGELQSAEAGLDVVRAGIRKGVDGDTLVRIDGVRHERMSELATLFPVLAVDAVSFDIVDGGPSERRQLLDWGLFHVEHGFLEVWKNYQVALRQKSALLKSGDSPTVRQQLRQWNMQMAQFGELIGQSRDAYVEALTASILQLTQEYLGPLDICLSYRHGWNRALQSSLLQCLEQNQAMELEKQTCLYGPHRADLVIDWGSGLARDRCSRGQKKLVLYAVRLAQVMCMQHRRNVSPVLLLDDIPAEFDQGNIDKIARFLSDYPCQSFITAISESALNNGLLANLPRHQMFHVEHGGLVGL